MGLNFQEALLRKHMADILLHYFGEHFFKKDVYSFYKLDRAFFFVRRQSQR